MKKLYLILFFLILFISVFVLTAFRDSDKLGEVEMSGITKRGVDTAVYPKLTIQDRTDYTIDVNPFEITSPHDTLLGMENRRYSSIKVPVRLSNHSDLPLKYIVMSCSWYEQFLISNKNMKILSWICQYNAPVVCVLPAHKDTIYTIPVVTIKQYLKGEKFKVATSLLTYEDYQHPDLLKITSLTGKNLIWSNEVVIP